MKKTPTPISYSAVRFYSLKLSSALIKIADHILNKNVFCINFYLFSEVHNKPNGIFKLMFTSYT